MHHLPDSLKGVRVPEELYDLQNDPIEYNNLMGQTEHEDTLLVSGQNIPEKIQMNCQRKKCENQRVSKAH